MGPPRTLPSTDEDLDDFLPRALNVPNLKADLDDFLDDLGSAMGTGTR